MKTSLIKINNSFSEIVSADYGENILVKTFLMSNTTSSSVEVEVALSKGGNNFIIFKSTIKPNTSLILLGSKDEGMILEEQDAIIVTSNYEVDVICSYVATNSPVIILNLNKESNSSEVSLLSQNITTQDLLISNQFYGDQQVTDLIESIDGIGQNAFKINFNKNYTISDESKFLFQITANNDNYFFCEKFLISKKATYEVDANLLEKPIDSVGFKLQSADLDYLESWLIDFWASDRSEFSYWVNFFQSEVPFVDIPNSNFDSSLLNPFTHAIFEFIKENQIERTLDHSIINQAISNDLNTFKNYCLNRQLLENFYTYSIALSINDLDNKINLLSTNLGGVLNGRNPLGVRGSTWICINKHPDGLYEAYGNGNPKSFDCRSFAEMGARLLRAQLKNICPNATVRIASSMPRSGTGHAQVYVDLGGTPAPCCVGSFFWDPGGTYTDDDWWGGGVGTLLPEDQGFPNTNWWQDNNELERIKNVICGCLNSLSDGEVSPGSTEQTLKEKCSDGSFKDWFRDTFGPNPTSQSPIPSFPQILDCKNYKCDPKDGCVEISDAGLNQYECESYCRQHYYCSECKATDFVQTRVQQGGFYDQDRCLELCSSSSSSSSDESSSSSSSENERFACCFYEFSMAGCLSATSEECSALKGTWNHGKTCSEINYCESSSSSIQGACAYYYTMSDNETIHCGCVDTTESSCENFSSPNGSTFYANKTCDEVNWKEECNNYWGCEGATCEQNIWAKSASISEGVFESKSSCEEYCKECDPENNNCPDGFCCEPGSVSFACVKCPTGACCYASSGYPLLSCDITTEKECQQIGGNWQRDGECLPDNENCNEKYGACCGNNLMGTNDCYNTLKSYCEGSGTFFEDTTCEENVVYKSTGKKNLLCDRGYECPNCFDLVAGGTYENTSDCICECPQNETQRIDCCAQNPEKEFCSSSNSCPSIAPHKCPYDNTCRDCDVDKGLQFFVDDQNKTCYCKCMRSESYCNNPLQKLSPEICDCIDLECEEYDYSSPKDDNLLPSKFWGEAVQKECDALYPNQNVEAITRDGICKCVCGDGEEPVAGINCTGAWCMTRKSDCFTMCEEGYYGDYQWDKLRGGYHIGAYQGGKTCSDLECSSSCSEESSSSSSECPPGYRRVKTSNLWALEEYTCQKDCTQPEFACDPGFCCTENPFSNGNDCLPCGSSSSENEYCLATIYAKWNCDNESWEFTNSNGDYGIDWKDTFCAADTSEETNWDGNSCDIISRVSVVGVCLSGKCSANGTFIALPTSIPENCCSSSSSESSSSSPYPKTSFRNSFEVLGWS